MFSAPDKMYYNQIIIRCQKISPVCYLNPYKNPLFILSNYYFSPWAVQCMTEKVFSYPIPIYTVIDEQNAQFCE